MSTDQELLITESMLADGSTTPQHAGTGNTHARGCTATTYGSFLFSGDTTCIMIMNILSALLTNDLLAPKDRNISYFKAAVNGPFLL